MLISGDVYMWSLGSLVRRPGAGMCCLSSSCSFRTFSVSPVPWYGVAQLGRALPVAMCKHSRLEIIARVYPPLVFGVTARYWQLPDPSPLQRIFKIAMSGIWGVVIQP